MQRYIRQFGNWILQFFSSSMAFHNNFLIWKLRQDQEWKVNQDSFALSTTVSLLIADQEWNQKTFWVWKGEKFILWKTWNTA